MKVLVDTHAFLWYFVADPRLSQTAATTMGDLRNELILSMASLWEIGIKTSSGKLTLPVPLAALIPQQLQQANIHVLEIKFDHVAAVGALPYHHKDPFDRMLVAQCRIENLSILSAEAVFDQYGIHRIW